MATFTSNLVPSGAFSMTPHWLTASRMDPLYMSTLAFRNVKYCPSSMRSTAEEHGQCLLCFVF